MRNSIYTLPVRHVFKIVFLPITMSFKKSRVRIYSERFKEHVTIDMDREDMLEDANDWLKTNGFNVIGFADGNSCKYIISDTFNKLKK